MAEEKKERKPRKKYVRKNPKVKTESQIDWEEQFKKRIRLAIQANAISLRKYSELSGVPYPSLSDYAAGKRSPGPYALQCIVTTSKVSPTWLLYGTGTMYHGNDIVDVNERLMSEIAVALEYAFARRYGAEVHHDGDAASSYAANAEEHQDFLKKVGKRAAMVAYIYNHIVQSGDIANLETFIAREAKAMVRLNQGFDVGVAASEDPPHEMLDDDKK